MHWLKCFVGITFVIHLIERLYLLSFQIGRNRIHVYIFFSFHSSCTCSSAKEETVAILEKHSLVEEPGAR